MIFWAIILFTWIFQTRLKIANFEPHFLRFSKMEKERYSIQPTIFLWYNSRHINMAGNFLTTLY